MFITAGGILSVAGCVLWKFGDGYGWEYTRRGKGVGKVDVM